MSWTNVLDEAVPFAHNMEVSACMVIRMFSIVLKVVRNQPYGSKYLLRRYFSPQIVP